MDVFGFRKFTIVAVGNDAAQIGLADLVAAAGAAAAGAFDRGPGYYGRGY